MPIQNNMNPAFFTSLGPTQANGGFSYFPFGSAGLPWGFGFPSFGDPRFYFMPAASSFLINQLLGFANGSAVNINIGPIPASLGFGGLLRGASLFDSGIGGDPFSFPLFGPGAPGYGTAFGGGGHYAPPGYGGPFNTPFQPGPSPFGPGGPFAWTGGSGPSPWDPFSGMYA